MKKQAEEYEKAKAAQEKQKADFEKMKTKFQEGVQLSQNKDYNGAITAFKEASAADPEQQAIWANLALALYNRGATQLNAGQRDPAKQDFVDSVGAADKALALVEPQLSDAAKGPEAKKSKAQYLKIKADANAVLAKRYSDAAAADAAYKDYQEAGNLTDDPGVKKTYTLKGAETLFDAGKSQEAITAYEAILQSDPENIEATYKLGLAYSGVEKYQEAANFLQRFVDKAPGTDPRVAEAKAVIDHLKVGNNITPQKTDTKGSRGAPGRNRRPSRERAGRGRGFDRAPGPCPHSSPLPAEKSLAPRPESAIICPHPQPSCRRTGKRSIGSHDGRCCPQEQPINREVHPRASSRGARRGGRLRACRRRDHRGRAPGAAAGAGGQSDAPRRALVGLRRDRAAG